MPFPAYPIIKKTAVFNAISKSGVRLKKGIFGLKNPIPRPLLNRYFCHIIVIKWYQISKKKIIRVVLF